MSFCFVPSFFGELTFGVEENRLVFLALLADHRHLVARLCLAIHCLAGSACRTQRLLQFRLMGCGGGASEALRSKAGALERGQSWKCSPRSVVIFLFFVWMLPVVGLGQENPADSRATTGTIQGTLKYIADSQRPWRLGRYYIRNLKSGELAEAVVAISKRGLKGSEEIREPVTAVVDQKDFQFTPETTAIRAGDHVRFLNNDDHTHNVRTSHPKQSFNVSMPVGSEHTETFSAAGGISQPYRIDCVFHTAMQSWIFVFDHPWFQVTAADGKFFLKNVPVGEYRFDAVHPAGDLRNRQTIQVVAGETTILDIRLQPNTVKP